MADYFRTIWKPLKWVPFPRGCFFLGLILECIMFPLMQISVGLMQKYLVNAVEYGNAEYVRYVCWMAAGVILMVFVLNPLGNYMKEHSMRIYTRNLREYAVGRVLSGSYSSYEKYQTGEWTARLRDNLNSIEGIYTESVFRLFMGIFYGAGAVLLMFTFSGPLSMAVIVLCILEARLMAGASEKITEENRTLQKITDRQYQLLFDLIKALSFIKMSSIAELIGKRYKETNDELTKKSLEINKVNVFLNMLEAVFETVNLILIFCLGVVLYFYGKIDLGSVMSFLFLQDGISYMISNLREFYSGYRTQIVSCERVLELLEQECEEDAEEGRTEKEGIYVQGVSFRYQDNQSETLRDIELRIPENKLTVIYGPSGSGKTTLMRLLLGLYAPDKGEIYIGESGYGKLGKAAVREYYAYVEQSPYLFHGTIADNIRGARTDAGLEEIIEAAKMAKAHDFIMKKPDGYHTEVRERGSNLSGGEKQRIAIARAILKNAKAVLLDEATSALDMENEAYIYDCIRQMVRSGKTVILIAHRPGARSEADYAVRMENGEIC